MPALAITRSRRRLWAVRFLPGLPQGRGKPIIGRRARSDGEGDRHHRLQLSGYSNLCRLFELCAFDQPKGEARATIAKVAEPGGDLFYLSATDDEKRLREMQEALGSENVFSELHHHLGPEASWSFEGRAGDGEAVRRPGRGDQRVHYHVAERRRLYDCWSPFRIGPPSRRRRPHLFPNPSTT